MQPDYRQKLFLSGYFQIILKLHFSGTEILWNFSRTDKSVLSSGKLHSCFHLLWGAPFGLPHILLCRVPFTAHQFPVTQGGCRWEATSPDPMAVAHRPLGTVLGSCCRISRQLHPPRTLLYDCTWHKSCQRNRLYHLSFLWAAATYSIGISQTSVERHTQSGTAVAEEVWQSLAWWDPQSKALRDGCQKTGPWLPSTAWVSHSAAFPAYP